MTKRFLIAAVVTALCHSLPSLADVDFVPRNQHIMDVHITANITANDARRILRLEQMMIDQRVRKPKSDWFVSIYHLDSIGGSVEAAMAIGRSLRRQGAPTHLFSGKKCLSACVLVLAGASSRTIAGTVAIHRPYQANDTEESPERQKEKYQRLRTVVTRYLEDMNVSPKLYDDMLYTSPEKVRVLTSKEVAEYGLIEDDPYVEEARAASRAKAFGISRLEYGKRTLLVAKLCPFPADDPTYDQISSYFDCESDVYSGRRK